MNPSRPLPIVARGLRALVSAVLGFAAFSASALHPHVKLTIHGPSVGSGSPVYWSRCRSRRRFYRAIDAIGSPLALLAAVTLAVVPPAVALPTGAQVVAGNVNIAHTGNRMTLAQGSSHAIVNWQSFGIGAGEQLRLHQPGTNAAMLARVVGNDPSQLLGQLHADGKLFLINPRGVIVGQGAVIDTAAFLASTLDISDADFLKNGALTFKGESDAGVVNLGKITAREGNVLLLAHTVKNAGEISAPKGTAGLAAGTEVFLASPDAPEFVIKTNLATTDAATGVENSGVIAAAQAQLQAAGGSIYDLAVNHSGFVQATGVDERNGRIILTADGGTVGVSGDATARNADGNGGEILVGGDFQGKNTAVPNAARTVVTSNASLDADATSATGDGGRVIVWADDSTRFLGSLSARGGVQGGDGGFAEVSGKKNLLFAGKSDLSAPFGKTGTLLLDPESIEITNSEDFPVGLTDDAVWEFSEDADPDDLSVQTLGATTLAGLLFENSITLQASNSITVNAPVTVGADGNRNVQLTLTSNVIAINSNISLANAANATLRMNGSDGESTAGTSVTLAAGATLAANTIQVNAFEAVTLTGAVDTNTLEITTGAVGGSGGASQIALTANNENNQITSLALGVAGEGGDVPLIGATNIRSDSAMQLFANASSDDVTIHANGNLTVLNGTGFQMTNNKTGILAATGGGVLINQAGSVFTGTGIRRVVYTSSTANPYAGLSGLTQINNVTYPADPNAPPVTPSSVVYVSGDTPDITITADDKAKVYGQPDPVFTATFSGSGDENDLNSPVTFTIAPVAHVNVGTYDIIPFATSTTHDLTFVNGQLTITPAALTIGAQNATRVYGDPNPGFTATFTGLVNGDTSSVLSGLTLSTTATLISNVGAYPITGSGATASNYTISYTNGTLTVEKAPLTVSLPGTSRAYGDANPNFAAFATATGLKNADTVAQAVPDLAGSTTANAASPVGDYDVTLSGTSANYTPVFSANDLTVTPATLTVQPDNVNIFYGDPAPAFTAAITGFKNGENASLVSGLTIGLASSGFTFPGAPAQAYSLKASGASAPNYTINYALGTLNVLKAPLTIAITNQSRAYGAPNPSLGFVTYSGLKNGETFLNGLTFSTTATTSSPVGAYPIAGSGTAQNYEITWVPGTLTINPAMLTLTPQAAGTFVYGDTTLPPFTFSIAGLVNGDTASVVDGTNALYGTSVKSTSPAGDYALAMAGATSTSANYEIQSQTGTLTVQPAPLTVAIGDASRAYGDANPAGIPITYSGFRNGDDGGFVSGLQLSIGAGIESDAGTYPITGSGASAANYTLSYVPGTLTVTKAPLAGTVANATRTYGAAEPAFSATFSGFRNGDAAADLGEIVFFTPAAAISPVGDYSILGAVDARNYDVSWQPGKFTITPATLTLSIDSITMPWDATPPPVTYSASGLVLGQSLSSVISGVTVPNLIATNAPPAATTIDFLSKGTLLNSNYTLVTQSGTLTTTKVPVTLTAPSGTAFVGYVPKSFTMEQPPSRLGPPRWGLQGVTNATNDSPAGSYTIFPQRVVPAGTTDIVAWLTQLERYYNFSFVNGTLTLEKLPPDTTPIVKDSFKLSDLAINNSIKFGEPGETVVIQKMTIDSPYKNTTLVIPWQSGLHTKANTPSKSDYYNVMLEDTAWFKKALLEAVANGETELFSEEVLGWVRQLDGESSNTAWFRLQTQFRDSTAFQAAMMPIFTNYIYNLMLKPKSESYTASQAKLVDSLVARINSMRSKIGTRTSEYYDEFQVQQTDIEMMKSMGNAAARSENAADWMLTNDVATVAEVDVLAEEAAIALGAMGGLAVGAVALGTLVPSIKEKVMPAAKKRGLIDAGKEGVEESAEALAKKTSAKLGDDTVKVAKSFKGMAKVTSAALKGTVILAILATIVDVVLSAVDLAEKIEADKANRAKMEAALERARAPIEDMRDFVPNVQNRLKASPEAWKQAMKVKDHSWWNEETQRFEQPPEPPKAPEIPTDASLYSEYLEASEKYTQELQEYKTTYGYDPTDWYAANTDNYTLEKMQLSGQTSITLAEANILLADAEARQAGTATVEQQTKIAAQSLTGSEKVQFMIAMMGMLGDSFGGGAIAPEETGGE